MSYQKTRYFLVYVFIIALCFANIAKTGHVCFHGHFHQNEHSHKNIHQNHEHGNIFIFSIEDKNPCLLCLLLEYSFVGLDCDLNLFISNNSNTIPTYFASPNRFISINNSRAPPIFSL